MSQSIQLQVTQVGLEQSIAAAMKRVGSSSQINLGTSSKQINALSQPLGRITGQADEFSKSMAAANARVLAFGASAGIIAGVSSAMSGLLTSTIKVEKSLVEISTVLNKTGSELDKFGQDIFNVAKNTGKSFDEVAKGALELARQGLGAEDTLIRLNDALILSRLSGLDAAQSVEGLTAAFNSFKSSGITTAEILNKVVAASQKYSVSEKDIIEGLKRSASVANLAGVSFEELAALITAVQEKTARGGAVIGNAFKTIFSRIQDKAVLSDLQDMGIAVTDLANGEVLPALKILENLAKKMGSFSQIEQADIAKKLGGVYQLDKLLAALGDLSDKASVTTGALKAMGEAGNKAYQKNAVLNQTLAALLNKVAVSAEQLGAKLGEIGVTDSLKNVLGFFNGLLEGIQKVLGEESGLGNLVRGLVKGLGSFLAGPGLAIFGAIILKLSKDLVTFGFASLKVFFGIGKAAKEVQNVEGAISQILTKNVNLQQQLFALEGNRAAQLRLITGALVEQEAVLRKSANISSGLAKPLYNVGAKATGSGLRIGNSADGYMPAVAKESKAIKNGVGGARAGDKPVVVPNFNFGGGKKGTMVAHTGEYIVPNFNGSGGSAVFNRRMVQSMGLPSGAKKIGAAGGFVPNFAKVSEIAKYNPRVRTALLQSGATDKRLNQLDLVNLVNNKYKQEFIEKLPNESANQYEERVTRQLGYQNNDSLKYRGSSAVDGFSRKSNSIKLLEVKSGAWNSYEVLNKFLRALPENYGTGNLLDVWTNNRDDLKVEAAIASPINKNFSAKQSGLFARSANGFIPNFAPKFNAETVRKYADEIQKYKDPVKDFYQFPDGTGGYGSQIKNVLSRQQSKAVANQQIKEKKIEDKGFYNLNADALGGILLVSPRFGKGQGSLDTSMQIGEIPFFNQDKSMPIDKNKYIKLSGIKTSNTPSGRDLKSLRADVNELFSDGIVKLANRLYGETFDPASGGEFSAKLQSLDASKKQQLLPPAAQGDLFEAAGKVALNSFANLESLFGSAEQNRPFDFQNPEALRKVFGVNAKRGEAKRGGEKNFSSSKQVQGIVKKIFNDSEYGSSAVKSLRSQGAFDFSKAQKAVQEKNAAGGFIPNFNDYKLLKQGKDSKREILDKVSRSYLQYSKNNDNLEIKTAFSYQKGSMLGLYNNLGEIAKKSGKKLFSPIILPQRDRLKSFNENSSIDEILKAVYPQLAYREKSNSKNTKLKLYLGGNSTDLSGKNIFQQVANYFKNTSPTSPKDLLSSIEDRRVSITSLVDTFADGYIPNFAEGPSNRGGKFTALQIAKGLGQAAIKILIDQYLGDGVVDSVEASGLTKMNPSDAKFFTAELKMPAKNKHRQAFEKALIADPEMQAAYPKYYQQLSAQIQKYKRDNAAGGFLPNFANPLQAAVGREMAAGVPTSQIYIDKSPALKNAANPMGLMVANRRDEPAGGFQGISRAKREGANPMTYGAAGGFVPNYAARDDSGGTSKVLATLFLFQTAVSVASGFFEQAGESGKKLSETLQKIASTALIFGGIAFSGPIKRLKEFADEQAKAKKATNEFKDSLKKFTQGSFKESRLAGKETNRYSLQGPVGNQIPMQKFVPFSLRERLGYGVGKAQRAFIDSPIGRGVGAVGRGVGTVGRGIGAAGVAAGGLLGPVTLAIGGFKVVGEALSGFRTYSNAAAKSLGQISVYAAKASESLSELDKTAIEAETNRRYGVTAGTLLGSISDITGASALASGISGQQISNTNYRGKNVQLSNVSEDTFKQIEKAFITSFVGANRTKFATAEDASGVAAAEFSEKFRNAFDEFDAENIKDEIKTLSEEAQRFQKDNAVAEALKQAKIQSELATRDVINFTNVLGESTNKIIKLKAKIFELKSSNEIFKALSEASIENASNLSEFEKVAQKLGTTLQSLDASKAVQELDLIAKTTENIDNTIKTNLKGLTVQEVGLGELYSEIKDLITSGNVEGINALINDTTKGTDITKLFGGDSRAFLQEQTKEFNAQTTEIKNQAKEAQNNLNIETYRSLLAQKTASVLESQTKQLDLQKSSAEKIFEYTEKIRSSTDKISDLNFERGLIGATQRQRLSAQIGRRPELDRRTREASLSNFKQDRVGFVQSLESLIPSTLSAELQLSLKSGILNATKSIREQNTLEDVSKKATDEYNKTIEEINNAVQEESKNRQSYIDKLQDALVGPSVTFGDSVVKAAQEFKRITIEAANIPYENRIKELQEQKGQIKSPTFTQAELDNLNKGKAALATLEARTGGGKSFKEKNQYLKEFPEIGAAFKKEEEIAKAEEAVKRLDDTITELETKIKNFSPAQSSSGIPFYLQPPDPAKLKSSTVVPLPLASQDEANKAREAAQKDQTAALLENTNSNDNLFDELEKIDSVARILADEFAQLKDGIPAAIASITSQRNKSISGSDLLGANYDLETQEQLRGAKSEEEYNKIIRDRQNKGIGQLFAEEYGKTSEEQALDLKKTIVDGSVQFKNNMIEGIMGAVEGTSSLKDGLRSAAYEFVKMINQKMMSNLADKLVGGNVQSGTGQTSGGLAGFFSNMFASGGKVTGGSGSKDDVPAMLMGGEYVVNKKAVSKYGPKFLEAINNGTLNGYAKGGKVQRGPQGNFYAPGSFGQGAISGKRDLLDFATQTGTSGKFDQMINESGYQSIALEPESSRLSVSGMRNSPMFDATQSAKGQAFDLYLQQYNAEIEAKKQSKENKKALTSQLLMLAGSAALGGIGKIASTGAKAAIGNLPKDAGFWQKFGTGFSGAIKGGKVDGKMVGGLANLFSGNFKNAFSILPKMNSKPLSSPDDYDISAPDGKAYLNNIYPIGENNYSQKTAGFSSSKVGFNIFDKYGNYDEEAAAAWEKANGWGRATGGMIPSRSGIDTVPAMLSGGEFVMNRSAVQSIGAPNLQSMNAGGTSITSEETSKELNEKLLAKLDELIGTSGSTGNITINVAPSGQTSQETSQDPSASRQQLARQIKDAVLQIINDEKRIGGSLRR